MVWYWTGYKSLSQHLRRWLPSLMTHICVTLPQWFEIIAWHRIYRVKYCFLAYIALVYCMCQRINWFASCLKPNIIVQLDVKFHIRVSITQRVGIYHFRHGVYSWYCNPFHYAWWRHQMETFSALLALCAGNSPVQRPVARSFDVFFYLRLIKPLGKQSRGWWFETPSRPLWRHCNGCTVSKSDKRDVLRAMSSIMYSATAFQKCTKLI